MYIDEILVQHMQTYQARAKGQVFSVCYQLPHLPAPPAQSFASTVPGLLSLQGVHGNVWES